MFFSSLIVTSVFLALAPQPTGSMETMEICSSRGGFDSTPDLAPGGVYIYEIVPGDWTQVGLDNIQAAFAIFESRSDLVFIERTTETGGYVKYVETIGTPNSGGGYPGPSFTRVIALNRNTSVSIVIHESMHLLGFGHEQSRVDREDVAEFNQVDIDSNQWFTNPNLVLFTPYDFDSIMHYPWWGGSRYVNVDAFLPFSKFARWWKLKVDNSQLTISDEWGLYELYRDEIVSPSHMPPPKPFGLTTPAYGANAPSAQTSFAWDSAELVVTYELQVDDSPSFLTPLISTTTTTNSASLDLSALTLGRAYFWRVRATNLTGTTEASTLPLSIFYFGNLFPTDVYVDDDAVANGDGANWANAIDRLEYALAVAYCAEEQGVGMTIHVAQGTYTPDWGETAWNPLSTVDLMSGVDLIGGFAGQGAMDPNLRDPEQFKSILQRPSFANSPAYEIVRAESVSNSMIDGFWLSDLGGLPDASHNAMYIVNSDVNIRNIHIESESFGSSLLSLESRSTAVVDKLIVENCLIEPVIGLFSNHSIIDAYHSNLNASNIEIRSLHDDINIPVFVQGLFNLQSSNTVISNFLFSDASFPTFPLTVLGGAGSSDIGPQFPSNANTIIISGLSCVNNDTGGISILNSNPLYSSISIINSVFAGNAGVDAIDNSVAFSSVAADSSLSGSNMIDLTGQTLAQLFTDHNNGNYTPNKTGILVDAGDILLLPIDFTDMDEDMDTTEASPLDILASQRVFDDLWVIDELASSPIDIGAIESQISECRVDFVYDGILDGSDALEFSVLYSMADPRADLNGDGVFNFYDISIFTDEFAMGCALN
jgi:astacin (peptidase family M12A)